jgi:hypothetical protein
MTDFMHSGEKDYLMRLAALAFAGRLYRLRRIGGSVTQTPYGSPTGSGAPPAKRGSGWGLITVAVSALALLVSVLSIGLSLFALRTADDASARSTTEPPVAPASNSVPAEPETATETPSATEPSATGTDAPLPTASANYTVSYEDKRLSLQPNGGACGSGRDVDLDQPAINVPNGSDVRYRPGCQKSPSLEFASDKVATVVSPNATPEDCAENIQLNAASQELTPSQDQVICAVTDGQGAPNQPERTKITRIVVSDVGQDQKVTLNVTAWEIPY